MGYERRTSFSGFQANNPTKPLPAVSLDAELDAISAAFDDVLDAFGVAKANGFPGNVIEWLDSLKGDRGPAGAQGDRGPAGPQGAKGDPGAAGAAASKGDPGPAGPIGPQGPQGLQGVKGDAGSQGLTGPKGDAGPAGPKGVQGLKGEVGSQGSTGPKGDTGLQGVKGDTGAVGAQGPQGLAGAAGAAGADGAPGAKGDMGPAGAQGLQGIKGDTGAQGLQGPAGVQGPQGAKGDQGAGVSIKGSRATPADLPAAGNAQGDTYVMTTAGAGFAAGDGYAYTGSAFTNVGQIRGPQGPAGQDGTVGAQGPQGLKGDTGLQGAQGVKGDTGAVGAAGAQGPAGTAGATGAQGPAGVKGDTGAQGIQGPKGDTGATGAAGVKGDTGATGAQGVKGDTGAAGAAGPQGIQGPAGAAGAQGTQGPQGVQGNTGATGPAAWALPVTYAAGIVASPTPPSTTVNYQGSTYVCKTAHTTTATFVAANWTLAAAKGDTGPAGSYGFTPVQQGTGPGQNAGNTVSLGWTNSNLFKVAVDGADQGVLLSDTALGASLAAGALNRAKLKRFLSAGIGVPGDHFVDISGGGAGFVASTNPGFYKMGIGTKVSDSENLWDSGNFWYNVPEDGLYFMSCSIRPPDSSGGYEFGFGLDKAEQDSDYFKWTYRPGVVRWVDEHIVLRQLGAGWQMRFCTFGYSSPVATASVRIYLVRAGQG